MIALIRNWILYLLALCGFCAFAINYTAWFSSFMFYLVLVLPFFSLIIQKFAEDFNRFTPHGAKHAHKKRRRKA